MRAAERMWRRLDVLRLPDIGESAVHERLSPRPKKTSGSLRAPVRILGDMALLQAGARVLLVEGAQVRAPLPVPLTVPAVPATLELTGPATLVPGPVE
jgi:hypothetical protein